MRYLRIIPFLILPLVIISSCNNCRSKKIVDEGIIEYSISYDDSLKKGFNPKLLPNRLTVKFHGNNTLNKIEGLSGAVTIAFVKNDDNKTQLILIKLLNKKLFYKESTDTINPPNFYSGMPDVEIGENKEQINFKGYKCSKVSANFKDSTNLKFHIIYTDEIKIANPNLNTPFEGINGVMLKFKVKVYGHLMTMTATKLTSTNVSMDEFLIPSNYEEINRKTLDDVISLLQ